MSKTRHVSISGRSVSVRFCCGSVQPQTQCSRPGYNPRGTIRNHYAFAESLSCRDTTCRDTTFSSCPDVRRLDTKCATPNSAPLDMGWLGGPPPSRGTGATTADFLGSHTSVSLSLHPADFLGSGPLVSSVRHRPVEPDQHLGLVSGQGEVLALGHLDPQRPDVADEGGPFGSKERLQVGDGKGVVPE